MIPVLIMDPSGSYREGNGTTGWVLMNEKQEVLQFGNIMAKDYPCRAAYYHAHVELIDRLQPVWLVLENYTLYAEKATQQIHSELETPRLIGVLEHHAWKLKIPLSYQAAAAVKQRWADHILVYKRVIHQQGNRSYINGLLLSRHIKDAIRHGMHFTSFNKEWKEYVKSVSNQNPTHTKLRSE